MGGALPFNSLIQITRVKESNVWATLIFILGWSMMCPIENITPVVGLQSEPNVDDKQNQITPAIE